MADFKFISIPELRECLESDYRELQACIKAEAWKAVHVLAGSIVEAVLIDALSGSGVDEAKLISMELGPLINLTKEKGLLQDEAVDLSTVIRKYRNLIHPGRIKRLEKIPDRSGAIVAAELVEIITQEIAKRKRETYGYTAEQLLDRLRSGSSALPLVAHLVADTQKREVERLLIDLIPSAYMRAEYYMDVTADECNHLVTCHRIVFNAAGDDVKLAVTKALYKVYRNEPEATVLIYEDSFFIGSDLKYLTEDERGFIKAHFLPRISTDTLPGLLANLAGIGAFLTPEEAGSLSMILMLIAFSEEKNDWASDAERRLMAEYALMEVESRREVREGAEYFDPSILAKLQKREEKIVLGRPLL
jgi:hypothetical protein